MVTIGEIKTKQIIKGDTFSELFRFKDKDELPFDLTIYSNIVMEIRTQKNDRSTLITRLELNNGITVEGDDNNELVIHLDSETTNKMYGGKYYRDIRFIQGDNDVKTYLSGSIEIINNISEL